MKLPTDYTMLKQAERAVVRSMYMEKQGYKCFYCGEFLNKLPPDRILSIDINWDLFPPGFLNNPIHLQHDHYTGMTEGAVHAFCNAFMWVTEER